MTSFCRLLFICQILAAVQCFPALWRNNDIDVWPIPQTTAAFVKRADASSSSSKSLQVVSQVAESTSSSSKSLQVVSQVAQSSSSKSDDSSSGSSSSKKSTSSISINPVDPAGGISLITPLTTVTTYVKSGDLATFSWTYTSLSVTPDYLDIQAYCSSNQQYYTLAHNHDSSDMKFVWNSTLDYFNNTLDLLTSEYDLYLYDSGSNITAAASAGYLSAYTLQFGIYKPQGYATSAWAAASTYINRAANAHVPVVPYMPGTSKNIGLAAIILTSCSLFTSLLL